MSDFIMDERTSKDVVEKCKESNMTKRVHKFLCIDESVKRKFWKDLDDLVQNIPINEKLYIKGNSNGLVGVCRC